MDHVTYNDAFDGDAVLQQLCSDLIGQIQTVKEALASFLPPVPEGRDARWARRKLRVLRRFLLQAFDVTSVVTALPPSLVRDEDLIRDAVSLARQLQEETREAIRVAEAFEKVHPAQLPIDPNEMGIENVPHALEGLVRLSADAVGSKDYLMHLIGNPKIISDDDVLDEMESDVEDALEFLVLVRDMRARWQMMGSPALMHGPMMELDIMLTGVEADLQEVAVLVGRARSGTGQGQVAVAQKRILGDKKRH